MDTEQIQELLEALTKRASACEGLSEKYHERGERGRVDAARTGGKADAYTHAADIVRQVLGANHPVG